MCFNREYVDLIDLTEDIFSDDDCDPEEPVVSANVIRFVHCHILTLLCMLIITC